MKEQPTETVPGSFRDPAGFVFTRCGRLYRQVNTVYAGDYRNLMDSGLYRRLVADGLLIAHEETDTPPADANLAYTVIQPEAVGFISYPYEWCFSQLKEAALLTLQIQQLALEHGMVLKDASAYNVQFAKGRAVHIDTLSFTRYHEGQPWAAYRQFCEAFLAPLALWSLRDGRLGRMLTLHHEGIPLDLATALLPARSWLKPALVLQLHLHARFQRQHASDSHASTQSRLSRRGMLALLDNLVGAVRGLTWTPTRTVWTDYGLPDARDASYDREKEDAVRGCLAACRPRIVCDLGANTGTYSRVAASGADLVLSVDADPSVVEINYRECRKAAQPNVLPLVVDIANPSPGIGWENTERQPFLQRIAPDAIIALALVHHLAIGNNLPLRRIARAFGGRCRDLIIEFVPEDDPLARRLIDARGGHTHAYSRSAFQSAFDEEFETVSSVRLGASQRTLHHLRARDHRELA